MRASFIAVMVGSKNSAFGISSSTFLKSLVIQCSWNCAVAICRPIIGTHMTNLRRSSVRASASVTNTFWSRAISACIACIDPGGRICQRAILA